MFFQRTHTIVLVTFDLVTRIDLRSGKSVEVVRHTSEPRSKHGDLGGAVKAALGQGSGKPGRVYILSDEIWSGRVFLDDEIANVVAEHELEQTLALQAEYDSGISPFDSRLGYALLSSADQQKTWWVTQADRSQLDMVSAAVRQSAGQLVAVSSLATLVPPDGDSAPAMLDVDASHTRHELAAEWLRRYSSGEPGFPVIGMLGQSRPQPSRIGLLAAVFVFAVCFAHYVSGAKRLARAQADLTELVTQAKQITSDIDKGEELGRRLREVEQQREAARRVREQQLDEALRKQAEHHTRRKRPVQLLQALEATADPGHWIQRIGLNYEQAVISGLACDTDAVTRLAQRLELELTPSGWLVRAAEISAHESVSLIRFQMTLVPLEDDPLRLGAASGGVTDAH